jgi:hypothetical protein
MEMSAGQLRNAGLEKISKEWRFYITFCLCRRLHLTKMNLWQHICEATEPRVKEQNFLTAPIGECLANICKFFLFSNWFPVSKTLGGFLQRVVPRR